VTKVLTSDDILEELIIFLGGRCFLCHKPYPDPEPKKGKRKKIWQIHHRKYRKGEKTSKDFVEKTPHIITRGRRKGRKTHKKNYHKDQYHEYLKPIVLSRPDPQKDFAAMHMNCHLKIGKIVFYNRNKEQRQRLCDLAMEQD